ncbi:hypothetical protein SAMN05660649_04053 [Desulfotomaculum arcticum]|uniref:Uncharacterized protein n=1 Tax=Desulfotruncus arcticus DSM 17038 TaxID=1121424 RepID=A0A1I2XP40_9FIRM|nr:hypothetical protein SAMN05660649_04053 [Desulfotomaculum arcticum] [Desulfotruncus arcticus DSM 17038]
MILADLLGAGTVILCGILIKYVKLYDLMAGTICCPRRKRQRLRK